MLPSGGYTVIHVAAYTKEKTFVSSTISRSPTPIGGYSKLCHISIKISGITKPLFRGRVQWQMEAEGTFESEAVFSPYIFVAIANICRAQ